LLPTLTKVLEHLTKFINHLNDSGDAAKYAKATVATVKGVVQDLTPIVKFAADAFKLFADHVGGAKHAIELLGAAMVTWKLAGVFSALSSSAGEQGAARSIGLLTRRLNLLKLVGPIAITIGVNEVFKKIGLGNALSTGDATAGDQTVTVGGRTYIRGSVAALQASQGIIPSGSGIGPNVAGNAFGSLTGQRLRSYLAAAAKSAGLDPNAVLAVASAEGGFGGAVGDSGTSFGPFQLHVGGALPKGLSGTAGALFSQSKQGIDYALGQIKAVAGGLTGMAAVKAIVTRFERPADGGAGDISRASSFLSGLGVTSMASIQAGTRQVSPAQTVAGIIAAAKKTAAAKAATKAANAPPLDVSGIGLGTNELTVKTRVASIIASLNASFAENKAAAAKLAKIGLGTEDLKVRLQTAGALAGANASITANLKAELAKEQKVWKTHVTELKAIATQAKGEFTRAFGDLATAALNAFDRATQKGMSALETRRSALTPAEQQLQDLQDAHDQTAVENQLAADQAAGDAQAVAEDLYQIQVRALQKQANLERTARDADFAAQEQNYQDQQDAQKQAFQTELQNLQAQIVAKHETVAQANSDILALMQKFGLDPAWFTSGANAGSALIQGLASAFQSVGSSLSNYDITSGNVAAATASGPGGGNVTPTLARGGVHPGISILAQVPHLATGGHILSSGLAFLHRGETVVPASGGGGVSVTVNVNGHVGSAQALAETIRKELTLMQKRGTVLGFT
jgi:hypothetical protein